MRPTDHLFAQWCQIYLNTDENSEEQVEAFENMIFTAESKEDWILFKDLLEFRTFPTGCEVQRIATNGSCFAPTLAQIEAFRNRTNLCKFLDWIRKFL